MKLVSWNVNGIRAVHNKNLFLPFIQTEKPDIICLQETKAEKGQATIDLPEYEEYWNSSTRKKGYAGTAIFVKKDLKVKNVLLGLPEDSAKKPASPKTSSRGGFNLADSYGDANAEGRVIAVELEDFYVVNVYTPNSKPDLSRLTFRHKLWDPAFLAYCKQLEKNGSTGSPHGKPLVFCGDLNVAHTYDDLANPKANEGEHGFTKEEREGIDKIISAGFVDTFRHFTPKGNGHYTWWTHWANSRARNVGWRIDYWFVSKKLLPRLKSASILPKVLGSDHCPVVIELK
ncbi:MAG: exodeoxyribonuclease III [bacterium]|nr:exodeoxyribonuclease III [bacterium]